MLRKLLQRATLFSLLHRIDEDLAETVRSKRCGQGEGEKKCGGPLHLATFERKPRGGPDGLPESFSLRLGLCCGWCRRRTLPPSVLFWGRKVYWGAVILVLTTLTQQRCEGHSVRRIETLFGVYRSTVARWIAYFREVFPQSESWRLLRGRLLPAVGTESIPRAVLARFFLLRNRADPEKQLVACLRALRLGVF